MMRTVDPNLAQIKIRKINIKILNHLKLFQTQSKMKKNPSRPISEVVKATKDQEEGKLNLSQSIKTSLSMRTIEPCQRLQITRTNIIRQKSNHIEILVK